MSEVTLIERQLELEKESRVLGQRRYNGEALPWREEEGTTKPESERAPGAHILKTVVGPTAGAIEEFMAAAQSGKAGRRHRAVALLEDVPPLAAAWITCKVLINELANSERRERMQKIATDIGLKIRDHMEFAQFKKDEKTRYKGLLQKLNQSTSERHRQRVLRHTLSQAATQRIPWGSEECFTVGVKLMELAIAATGIGRVVTVAGRRKNESRTIFEGSPEVIEWIEKQHGYCELLTPFRLPMLVKPLPWTTPFDGGYLDRRVAPLTLVKTRNRAYLEDLANVDMPGVYSAVNALQDTPWRINAFVLDVLRQCWARGDQLGGLPPVDDTPLPARPEEIEHDKEARKTWSKEAAQVHAYNASLASRRKNVEQKLYVAQQFAAEDRFYFPYQLDFRGRAYPACGTGTVNPQGDDVGKALLEFAEGVPLGESGGYWLAVHIANLFGVDKCSFDERVAWVQENSQAIMDSGINPLDGGRFWCEADDPWCALSACREWAGFMITGDDYVSRLPIAMDGSCNGLQHFSACLRDREGGEHTNLVPAEKPSDIYMEVARRLEEKLASMNEPMALMWRGNVSRKIAKQPVMTLPYGSTVFGMRDMILGRLKDARLEDGKEIVPKDDEFAAAMFLAPLMFETIREVVTAAQRAMDWLQSCAKVVSKVNLPVRWTMPMGLPVVQEYRKAEGREKEVFFGGRRFRVKLATDTTKINAQKNASSISPNYVHSLDSAHMMATVNGCMVEGISSFAMVHDSYGCHAAYVGELSAILRYEFVSLYSGGCVLQRFREELCEQLPEHMHDDLPPVPDMGSLDLASVLESDFFFA